jgi:hypothetical protein
MRGPPSSRSRSGRTHMRRLHQVGTLDDYSDITLAAEVNTSNAIKSFQPVYVCGRVWLMAARTSGRSACPSSGVHPSGRSACSHRGRLRPCRPLAVAELCTLCATVRGRCAFPC